MAMGDPKSTNKILESSPTELVANDSNVNGAPKSRHASLSLIALSVLAAGLALLAYEWNTRSVYGGSYDIPDDYEDVGGRVIQDLTYWPDILNYNKDKRQVGKEKAVMFMLVRNFELHEALESMRSVEDRFNRHYKYPWVFLNDEQFTEEFKELTTGMASGESHYGFIPAANWSVPEYINKTKMHEAMDQMKEDGVIYGDSVSYRNMCRFNSGRFFQHPLMDHYDWYWRVEPGVKFFCDQRYDPFTFLRENNKVYGFVLTLREYPETIATLWDKAKEFFSLHPDYIAKDNALDFVTDNRRILPDDDYTQTDFNGYNLCHFWSNFEIGSLKFFRDQKYTDYFEYLEQSGGFYYERWGDAPVHTLGLVALANKSQIHHFSDIGYYHIPYRRCPHDEASYITGRCLCPANKHEEADFQPYSCLPLWWHHAGRQFLFNFTNAASN